jgi:hypothetical protein
MSDASPDTPRGPASALVYPDVYLPEDLARIVAERAEAAHITPSALLASLIERFVLEHAGESREPAVASASAAPPEDAWDAPGMVRRIVPLPAELAQAVARLAEAWQRPVNELICDAVQAAFGESDSGHSA